MNKTTDFITELVRAANEVNRITQFERRRLLERAAVTIGDLRDQTGMPSSRTGADALIDLQTTAVAIASRSDEQVKSALLTAADMIRSLRILLDTRTKGQE